MGKETVLYIIAIYLLALRVVGEWESLATEMDCDL